MDWPAGQALQYKAPVVTPDPSESELELAVKCPAVHVWHADVEAALYCPAPHAVHVVAAVVFRVSVYEPAVQF